MVARLGTQPGHQRPEPAAAVTASEQGRLPARSPSEEIKTSWGAEDQVLSVSVRCDNVRPDGSTDDEAPPVSRAVAQEDPC